MAVRLATTYTHHLFLFPASYTASVPASYPGGNENAILSLGNAFSRFSPLSRERGADVMHRRRGEILHMGQLRNMSLDPAVWKICRQFEGRG